MFRSQSSIYPFTYLRLFPLCSSTAPPPPPPARRLFRSQNYNIRARRPQKPPSTTAHYAFKTPSTTRTRVVFRDINGGPSGFQSVHIGNPTLVGHTSYCCTPRPTTCCQTIFAHRNRHFYSNPIIAQCILHIYIRNKRKLTRQC